MIIHPGNYGHKKVLVTGSEGYIGSVLIDKLLEEEYDVVGLDTLFFKIRKSALKLNTDSYARTSGKLR